jgi:hypothetical protein
MGVNSQFVQALQTRGVVVSMPTDGVRAKAQWRAGSRSASASPATLRLGTIGNTTREGYWPSCRIVWAAVIISVAVPNFAPVSRLRS